MNIPRTGELTAAETVTLDNVAMQMAYVAQQQLDGYTEMVAHAIKCKAVFDKRVLNNKPDSTPLRIVDDTP